MIGFRHTLGALLLTMLAGVAVAQNNTNSSYTRYGYGELTNRNFGNSKAMGGVAFGLRDRAQINPLNPASYTAIDSLTFLFEGGVSLQNTNVSSGVLKLNAKNSSFDYLAMQFRLHPRVAMSIGMLPFSNVGYSVSDTRTTTDSSTGGTLSFSRSFTGDGGLHQLYAGVGLKVLPNLSVGANLSYFWGDITRTATILFPGTSDSYSYIRQTALSVSDYKLDFGAQYTHVLDKERSLTVGAVYSFKRKMGNQYTVTTQSSSSVAQDLDARLWQPAELGVGVTYNQSRRLTLGADFSLQQWSKAAAALRGTVDEGLAEDFAQTYALADRSKISVGLEYIPNSTGRSYLSHIKYRLGGYYATPYYKIGGKRALDEFGITGGFGLPVPRSRSILSLSGQFVRVKGLDTNLVSENIFRLSIGLTFNERWFFKRRVE